MVIMFSTTRLTEALVGVLDSKLTRETETPFEDADSERTQKPKFDLNDLLEPLRRLQNILSMLQGGQLGSLAPSFIFKEPTFLSNNEAFSNEKKVCDDNDQMEWEESDKTHSADYSLENCSSEELLEELISTSQRLLYTCSQFETEHSAIVERGIIGTIDMLCAIQSEFEENLSCVSNDLPHFVPTRAERDLIRNFEVCFAYVILEYKFI